MYLTSFDVDFVLYPGVDRIGTYSTFVVVIFAYKHTP